jgi:peroxiredoxin
MPIFNADEENELKLILKNAYLQEEEHEIPSFDENKSILKKKVPDSKSDGNKSTIKRPNSDWRSANKASVSSRSDVKEPGDIMQNAVDSMYAASSDLEFDYDDLDKAMREEDTRGMFIGQGTSKRSHEVMSDTKGLKSGDKIEASSWELLTDHTGDGSKLSRLAKVADILCVVADPRRGTDDFRLLLSQLNKIPKSALGIEVVAINADEWNDHRKYLKKNTLAFSLLADPKKAFMSQVKCIGQGRLATMLLLLDVSSGRVLKVWYEDDWDTFNTKDLIVDEMKEFRKDPASYVQSQIGIR